jgi:hypothetical protein
MCNKINNAPSKQRKSNNNNEHLKGKLFLHYREMTPLNSENLKAKSLVKKYCYSFKKKIALFHALCTKLHYTSETWFESNITQ